MTSSTIAIIVTIITMVLFFVNKLPMSVVSIIGALAMGILVPEMSLSDIYSGFGASAVVMTAGMCVVGDALFQTGMAERIGSKIGELPFAQNERWFIVLIVTICTLMSAFLSNSGCIAMWMPIIAAVAAGSRGKIRSKMVIMPAGIACIVGGAATLVGSTAQNTANAILMGYEGYESGMSVFDMTRVMLPVCIIQIIYFATIGYPILKWALKPGSPDFDKGNMYAVPPDDTGSGDKYKDVPAWKGTVSVAVLLCCIVGFILTGVDPFSNYLDIATVALLGSVVLFITKCMPVKSTLAGLPWDVLITIGAVSAIGTGLDVSGGGQIIADYVLGLFGGASASPAVLMAVGAVLSSVLTLFLQNVSVAAILTPIYISMALSLGISPLPFVIIIAIGVNMAIATPIGTAVNMQILPAGYVFKDYVKVGGPLFVVLVAAICIIGPIVLL